MATQVQELGLGPAHSAQPQLLAVLRTMLSPLPKPTSSPTHLCCCDGRFRFSSQTLFSFCHWMPKPTLSGEGIFFSLSQNNPPSWVGMPGSPGSLASWQHGRGLGLSDGIQKPISPSALYSLLSPGSRKGLTTGTPPPALQTSLPLGSTNALISHTEPSRVFPCSSSPCYQRTSVFSRPVPDHNRDQVCSTSATSLSHS